MEGNAYQYDTYSLGKPERADSDPDGEFVRVMADMYADPLEDDGDKLSCLQRALDGWCSDPDAKPTYLVQDVVASCAAAGHPLSVVDFNVGMFTSAITDNWDGVRDFLGFCATDVHLAKAESIARDYGYERFRFSRQDPMTVDVSDLRADIWVANCLFSRWPCARICAFLSTALLSGACQLLIISEVSMAQTSEWAEPVASDGRRDLSPLMSPLRYYVDSYKRTVPGYIALCYSEALRLKMRASDTELAPRSVSVYDRIEPSVYDVGISPPPPLVFIALFIKDAEHLLPIFFEHLDSIDYPKNRIVVYIRTNNNTDNTVDSIKRWVNQHQYLYETVLLDRADLDGYPKHDGPHDWVADRLVVMGKLRQKGMELAMAHRADFYLTIDVDNFVHPKWLRSAVALDLPIVGPMLRKAEHLNHRYSNFHGAIDPSGYFAENPVYDHIINGDIKGVVEVPVIHCTYLVAARFLPKLTYLPDPDDTQIYHEYVIFSRSARRNGVTQYLDCRRDWGLLTMAGKGEVASVDWVRNLHCRKRELLE